MPLCASLVHSHRAAGWTPCSQRAQRGDLLCSAHRDALDGVVMGVLESNYLAHVHQQRKAARQNGAILNLKSPRVDLLAASPFFHPSPRPRRKRKRRKRNRRRARRAAVAAALGRTNNAAATPAAPSH